MVMIIMVYLDIKEVPSIDPKFASVFKERHFKTRTERLEKGRRRGKGKSDSKWDDEQIWLLQVSVMFI
jgi:hypothetical protein